MTTTRFGIDGTNIPSTSALKAAGVTFVIGYVSHSSWKSWTFARINELRGAGIDIVFVFEDTAARALVGYDAGREDAAFAAAKVSVMGAPTAQPIYFAVDLDTTAAHVSEYVRGLVSAIGKNRVGIYGGRNVIGPLLDQGAMRYAWQTYAWSGGTLDPRAHLYQYANGRTLAGSSVDYNHAYAADFGQWAAHAAPPPAPTVTVTKPAAPSAPTTIAGPTHTTSLENLMASVTFTDANEMTDLIAKGMPEDKAREEATVTYTNETTAIAGALSFLSSILRDMTILKAEVAALKPPTA